MRKALLPILLTALLFAACSKDGVKTVDDDPKDKIEYFNANLKAEMKYDDIVKLFGEPDGDIGSGIHIYYYELSDGSRVFIGYADKIMYARHLSASGQVLHNII
jgi:hypothetical protein